MVEGWQGEDYLILFDEDESVRLTVSYALSTFAPNYIIIGLCGWDDFVLRDSENRLFTLPTVPMDAQHLNPIGFVPDQNALQADDRFKDKIKWYVKPLIFGGDPKQGENMAWINLQEPIEAVKFWNLLYVDIKKHQ